MRIIVNLGISAVFYWLLFNLFLNYELFNPIDHPPVLDIFNYIILGQAGSYAIVKLFRKKPKVTLLSLHAANAALYIWFGWILLVESGINMESYMSAGSWLFIMYPNTMGILLTSTIIIFNLEIHIYLKQKHNQTREDRASKTEKKGNQTLFDILGERESLFLFFLTSSLVFLTLWTLYTRRNLFIIAVFVNSIAGIELLGILNPLINKGSKIAILSSERNRVFRSDTPESNIPESNIPESDTPESSTFEDYSKKQYLLSAGLLIGYFILYYGLSTIMALSRLMFVIFLFVSEIQIQKSIPHPKNMNYKIGHRVVDFGMIILSPLLLIGVFGISRPRFFSQYLFYFILGILLGKLALIFLEKSIFKKNQWVRSHPKKITFAGLFFFLIHFGLAFYDSFTHGYNYEGSFYSDIWPFSYIGGFLHGLITGISVFLFYKGVFSMFYPETPKTHKTHNQKVLFWNGWWFLLFLGAGLMIFVPNFNIFTYGGGTSKGIPEPGDLYYTITTLGFIAIAVIFGLVAILTILKKVKGTETSEENIGLGRETEAKRIDYDESEKKPPNNRSKTGSNQGRRKEGFTMENQIPAKISTRTLFRTILLFVIILVPISIVQAQGFKKTHERPVVGFERGSHLIWIQNNSEHVAPDAMIAAPSPTKAGQYSLSMAKNEYEAFQIVINPLETYLNDISFKIHDLQGNLNQNNTISKENISIRYARPLLNGQYADWLEPWQNQPHLSPGRNHVFWVSIRSGMVASDTYNGDIEIYFDRKNQPQATLDLSVKVWNFSIPEERHIRGNVGGQTHEQRWLEHYYDHRINSYGVKIDDISDPTKDDWTGYACWFNETDYTWIFNWTWWDQQTAENLANGETGFRVTSPLDISGNPERWEDERWYNGTINYYREVNQHFMDKGWDDEAYFYDIDEPQYHLPAGVTLEEYFEKLAPILKDIKDVAPELKMAITYAPTKEAEPVYDYIDIWIPLNSMYDEEAVRERQSAGDEVWFYTCVQPVAPYPNTMFFNHLFETRLLMWQVYHHGLDGYLFWRSWSYRHQNYAVGYNGWGDGVLLYEDLDENVYDSIRWEQLFQSQEDYEYFWLLNETINEMRGTSNEEKATAFQAEINGLLEDMITNHKDFKRDPRLMYKIRQKIGNFIHQHSG